MGPYLVGIDIGGTFTDCVVARPQGRHHRPRCPRRRPTSRGHDRRARVAADRLGLPFEAFCRDIAFLSHGTTVGTNTIIQKQGREGRPDHHQGPRGRDPHHARLARLRRRDIRKVVHFPETSKPDPIVPKRLIRGVSERVDCFGEVVVAAERSGGRSGDPRAARGRRARRSRSASCGRSATPSTSNACKSMVRKHRARRVRDLLGRHRAEVGRVRARHRDGAERLPRPGDVGLSRQPRSRTRRSSATATPLQITQCGGGIDARSTRASDAPLLTLDSGPVSGVTGSMFLGKLMGETNIITTDMGGTSFDVGIVD